MRDKLYFMGFFRLCWIVLNEVVVAGDGQEQKAFCMKKDDAKKEITFVLKESRESVNEIVSIQRIDGSIIVKRPNGYIVTLVK